MSLFDYFNLMNNFSLAMHMAFINGHKSLKTHKLEIGKFSVKDKATNISGFAKY